MKRRTKARREGAAEHNQRDMGSGGENKRHQKSRAGMVGGRSPKKENDL